MWTLYQLLLVVAYVLAAPWLLLRRGRHYLATLPGRLGGHKGPVARRALWIHAVSVGEVSVAATLVRALPRETPLLITTVTPTGQSRARAAFHQRGSVTYLPLELGFAVRRFFRRFAPRALVLVEGDLWPLVLRNAARSRLPILVINGRVSDGSFKRLCRLRAFPRLLAVLYSRIEGFGVQSEVDRRRLLDLGVTDERVLVTGNLKYETPEPKRLTELETELRRLAAGRPILVAGSTMGGEEELVVKAFEAAGGAQRALLILAPRHPERWDSVESTLRAGGVELLRRSALSVPPEAATAGPKQTPPQTRSRVGMVLLDSLGELASLYRLATAAFIGGTLVPTGGHNPVEAARFGVAIAVGPSMENFREMEQHFDEAQAWAKVTDADDLGHTWRQWLERPESAREVGQRALRLVSSHRGALERTMELLAPVLARFSSDRS